MKRHGVLLALLGALVLSTSVVALRIGARPSTWHDLLPVGDSLGQEIVFSLRMPRVLMALLVGAALSVAGTLMQALTRNRLAGPSLMGLAPGAMLAVLIALVLTNPNTLTLSLIAFVGAGVGGALVFGVAAAAPRGATPQRLVLAGAVVGGMLTSITGAIIFRLQLSEVFLYWTLGGLGTTTWPQVLGVSPLIAVGTAMAWALAPSLTLLLAGDERAQSLGQQTSRVRALTGVAVLLLAGGATAAAGPVGFVGVLMPNLCRALCGPDVKRLLPVAALAGAFLVVAADLVARQFVGQFIDVPLGAVTAVLGAPAVIWIARQGVGRRQR